MCCPAGRSVVAVPVEALVAVDGSVMPAHAHRAGRGQRRVGIVVATEATPGIAGAVTAVDTAGTRQVDGAVAIAVMALVALVVSPVMSGLVAAAIGVVVTARDMAAMMLALLVVAGDGRADDRADGDSGDDLARVVAGAHLCRGDGRGEREGTCHEGHCELGEHGSYP